jgi:hypothetical protein
LYCRVEFEGPKTTLFIRGAKLTDAGWYQCTATSPAGTAITKCKVTVIRMDLICIIQKNDYIFFALLALSDAGQLPQDLPQYGPQILSKIPA